MDAQIANTPNNPQVVEDIKPDVGASYANALLSHKQLVTVKNNKENIMEKTIEPLAQKITSDGTKQVDSDISKLVGDDDGTFTPVINNSRKERKVEKHRKQKHVSNGTSDKNDIHEKPDKKETHSSKEKQKDVSLKDKKQHQREHSDERRESFELQTDPKKIFVEAPLPKTNPWQVKNSNVHVGPEATIEKRILQPQKQETHVNGSNLSVPSTSVKDKKNFNKKVSYVSNLFKHTCF